MPGGKHLNMQAWAPEEDQIILDMVAAEGPKWSRIVQRLPGRTVSSVRNRWQRIEKGRKLREAGIESKNRCHQCGEPKRGHVCFAKLKGAQPPSVASEMNRVSGSTATSSQMHPAPQMPPAPPRRTRSSERIEQLKPPSSTESERLRSLLIGNHAAESLYSGQGPSLFPPAADAPAAPVFTVDVAAATNPAPPPQMLRSETSFFRGLFQEESEGFSPCTRELFESWASSPTRSDKPMPSAISHAAHDDSAPHSLKRFASGETSQVPKLTRSLSSYLCNAQQSQSSSQSFAHPHQPQHHPQHHPQQPPQQRSAPPHQQQSSQPFVMPPTHATICAAQQAPMPPMPPMPPLYGATAADPHLASHGNGQADVVAMRPPLSRRRSSRLSASFLLDVINGD